MTATIYPFPQKMPSPRECSQIVGDSIVQYAEAMLALVMVYRALLTAAVAIGEVYRRQECGDNHRK